MESPAKKTTTPSYQRRGVEAALAAVPPAPHPQLHQSLRPPRARHCAAARSHQRGSDLRDRARRFEQLIEYGRRWLQLQPRGPLVRATSKDFRLPRPRGDDDLAVLSPASLRHGDSWKRCDRFHLVAVFFESVPLTVFFHRTRPRGWPSDSVTRKESAPTSEVRACRLR